MAGAGHEPIQILGRGVVLVAVSGFDIGALEQFEPAAVETLFAGPSLDQTGVHVLGQGAEEFDVVRAREIEGVDEKEAGVGGFDGLVQREGCELATIGSDLKVRSLQQIV